MRSPEFQKVPSFSANCVGDRRQPGFAGRQIAVIARTRQPEIQLQRIGGLRRRRQRQQRRAAPRRASRRQFQRSRTDCAWRVRRIFAGAERCREAAHEVKCSAATPAGQPRGAAPPRSFQCLVAHYSRPRASRRGRRDRMETSDAKIGAATLAVVGACWAAAPRRPITYRPSRATIPAASSPTIWSARPTSARWRSSTARATARW